MVNVRLNKIVITEDQLEQLCLDWFKSIGYDYVCGYDIAPDGAHPERNDYRQIILHGRLLNQLQIINPHMPTSVLEDVALQIAKPETPVLIKSNKAFHQFLLEGVKVDFKDKGKDKTDYVRLVEYITTTGERKRHPDKRVFTNELSPENWNFTLQKDTLFPKLHSGELAIDSIQTVLGEAA